MRLLQLPFLLALCIPAVAQTATAILYGPEAPSAVKLTNPKAIADAQKYKDIVYHLSPELASAEGAKPDNKIEDISLGGQRSKLKTEDSALKKLMQVRDKESDPAAKQELSSYIDSEQARIAAENDALAHQVTFINAATYISNGLAPLLDPAAPNSKHITGGERMKRYDGMDPDPQGNISLTENASMLRGTAPMTGVSQDLFFDNSLVTAIIKRTTEQMKKPGMIYPSRADVVIALEHNNEVINGLLSLFRKDNLSNWEPTFAALQRELVYYDKWVKENYLPKTK